MGFFGGLWVRGLGSQELEVDIPGFETPNHGSPGRKSLWV